MSFLACLDPLGAAYMLVLARSHIHAAQGQMSELDPAKLADIHGGMRHQLGSVRELRHLRCKSPAFSAAPFANN